MRYREGTIPKTLAQLRDAIVSTLMRAPSRNFPPTYGRDFDGAYYTLARGVDNLRRRLGDAKADQLLDMFKQAKAHHEADDKLGSRLLQDADMIVAGRQPFAYPKELYRWPIGPELPEVSEADLINDAANNE